MRRVANILDLGLDKLDVDGVLRRIEDFILSKKQHHITYLNAHCTNLTFTDKEYKDIILNSDLVYSDGMALVWASYFYGDHLPERVNLGDFLPRLCNLCGKKGYKIFLLGGREGVAEKAADNLKKEFHQLKIAGAHHGFFDDEEENTVIDEINKASPDIILVGMGVPKQEKWIAGNKNRLGPAVLWGVGSLFDYYAGYTKRAPVWMRKIGLEWLFRLLIEPLRLWKRYMVGNLIFVFRIFSPVIIDMLLVSVAWISAYSLRLSIDPLFSIPIGEFRNYLYMLPLIALSWPFILSFFGLYNRKKALNQITYMADILKAVSTGLIIAVTYSYLFREAGIARSFLVIWAIVNFFILLISRSMLRLNELSSEPFIEASFHQPSLSYLIFKEFADRVAALLAIIITLPLWWFLALLIKIDSAGPAFFTQTRVGKNSRHFTVYKFRTMFKETNPNEPAPLNVKDQRITRVGRFLRRWSLDGLPQFLNVLKGDMSIVGPRPEMTFIVKDYEPWQMQRLKVKPGIAGLWQVTGRKDIPLHQNIEYDFYYINNRSFMIDLAIILKSIPAIFFKKGAY